MESLTSITLNLQNPNIATVAYGVQNDRLSRKITAQLVDGSTPWTPPAGALATIRFLKPDGKAGFYDTDEAGNPATVIDGSAVTMTIVEQALTVPGDVYMQLNFYTSDGERLTTFCWLLRVRQNVLTDATIISSDYYNILSAQITAVLEAAAALTGMTASASGLPTGSEPTVTVTGGTEGEPYNLAFGLPAGPVGPPEVPTTTTEYQEGTSPTTPPTGTWQNNPPTVAQGNYLWTRTVLTYSSGTTATFYSVARQGLDGAGTVNSVDNVSVASGTTNVPLGAVRYSAAQSLTSSQQAQARENMGLLDYVYPVGSIYMSVNSTSPGTLFGGTWDRITGRFLLAATDGGSSGASQAAGNTGGEAEHTLTGAESGQKALSISGGGHNHTVTYHFKTQNVASGSGATLALGDGSGERSSTAVATTAANTGTHTHTVTASDAANAHNNMPPYLSVYVWKRTA